MTKGSSVLAAACVASFLAMAQISVVAHQQPAVTHKPDWMMPVLNAMICPLTSDAWGCGRDQASRMLDVFSEEINIVKQSIKDEADAELAERISQRGFSESEEPKEKPSAVMSTLDEYVTNGIYSFLGRKNHNHMHSHQKPTGSAPSQQVQVSIVPPPSQPAHHQHQTSSTAEHQLQDHNNNDDDDDYDEDEEYEHGDTPEAADVGHGHAHGGHHHNSLKKRKPHRVGLKPLKHKYGREFGVTRGKKHKKKFKKALMKLLVIGTILKAKLEFLLKIVGTHLQIKFFIIAVIGLLVNIAKFWIDLKRGHQPQKVIYYEHAQHQHHYDEHDDGWGGGGGYWKRSFDQAEDDTDNTSSAEKRTAEDNSYPQLSVPSNAHNIAYSRQVPTQF